MQADAACPDNADYGGRAGIGFDVIEPLAGDDRQDLRDQAKAHRLRMRTAAGQNTFDRLAVCRLQRFREQFAESPDIGRHDGQHTGKRAKADHVDPDQCPDQRIDTPHNIQTAAGEKLHNPLCHDIARRQQGQRKRQHTGKAGAQKGNGQRFGQRQAIHDQPRHGFRIGRHHQPDNHAQFADTVPDPQERKFQHPEPVDEQAEQSTDHKKHRQP